MEETLDKLKETHATSAGLKVGSISFSGKYPANPVVLGILHLGMSGYD
jgi:hypothetical protein